MPRDYLKEEIEAQQREVERQLKYASADERRYYLERQYGAAFGEPYRPATYTTNSATVYAAHTTPANYFLSAASDLSEVERLRQRVERVCVKGRP